MQRCITYKALWEGIPRVLVDPHYTTTTCNKCGRKGERNKWLFRCRYCGHIAHVDENAARNITLKALKVMSAL